jgi:uncharacterized protein YyaL (SSP411 family)
LKVAFFLWANFHPNYTVMKNNAVANALANETSPYLLQHAYNPVSWYPWGPEALALAKQKDLPILVSIGYSACHWCHVMERESFEDETVAAFMNEHFVNIKIDREERPDLDHFYMDAVQAISGSGGWPLNVFLTPDTKPFYGGTYYPPQKAFNRSSWTEVLHAMSDVFLRKREEVEQQAETLLKHLQQSSGFLAADIFKLEKGESFYSRTACLSIAGNLLDAADKNEGGFGKAPKFLHTPTVNFLLAYAHLAGHQPSLKQANLTLMKMLNGGIYDQLGGGISRYSTDNEWLVPHFEKMLYDNALLVSSLCDAYQATGDKKFEEGLRFTLNFVRNEMKSPEGGYYTAIDADSEGVEGKFYVWNRAEIEEMLGPDAALFCDYFDVTTSGNWEETNILNVRQDLLVVATRHELSIEEASQKIGTGRAILLAERNKRVPPSTDDKILLNCNALLLAAFCKAYGATGIEEYKTSAVELARFILVNFLVKEGSDRMYHSYKNGTAKQHAFLDDYAYLVEALILLQEITSDQSYLLECEKLVRYVLNQFSDSHGPFLFYSDAGQNDILVRKIELYDGATPSANAVMAKNLLYLGIILGKEEWREKGNAMQYAINEALQKYPTSFAVWACNYLNQAFGFNEITVTGSKIQPLTSQVLRNFIPNRILQGSEADDYEKFPMLKNKLNFGDPRIQLCRDGVCLPPVSTVADLLDAIKNL